MKLYELCTAEDKRVRHYSRGKISSLSPRKICATEYICRSSTDPHCKSLSPFKVCNVLHLACCMRLKFSMMILKTLSFLFWELSYYKRFKISMRACFKALFSESCFKVLYLKEKGLDRYIKIQAGLCNFILLCSLLHLFAGGQGLHVCTR